MENRPDAETLKKRDRLFTIAIPLLSFGGIPVAMALQHTGFIADAGEVWWGCVAASFLLGYFAYIKPKRDIVALCSPIYGIILFLIPGEIPHNLLLQALFAVSITILLIRLNLRFGSLADIRSGSNMEKFLHAYIGRIRPDVPALPGKTAHAIASAFLSFKFGLFGKTAEQCKLALASVPEGKISAALAKALTIVQTNAEDLENSQVRPDMNVAFTAEELAYAAMNIPAGMNEDPASLELDNALVLLYAVAMITSPDDEEMLAEHQNYVIRILSSYKSALGIK